MPVLTNRRVVAVAYDGLCAFEFGVAVELFGLERPELELDWYDFEVVSADPGPIRALGGVTLQAPTNLDLIASAGTVVLPGWRDPAEIPPVELSGAIRAAHQNGARVMSICSGVFVLAATGLLDGQAATTHWRYTDQLRSMYPDIDVQPDVLYVDNGTTLTSAGSAAGLDLGLHLIRRDHGADVANRVARRLVVPPHRSGGQAQFISEPMPADPPRSIAPTVAWVQEHLDNAITVDDMAAQPHQWLTRQRVTKAQRLLETTDLPIDTIATSCGFGSAATLRHHFQREARTTPSAYRSSFAAR